jgi:hypothetical protein
VICSLCSRQLFDAHDLEGRDEALIFPQTNLVGAAIDSCLSCHSRFCFLPPLIHVVWTVALGLAVLGLHAHRSPLTLSWVPAKCALSPFFTTQHVLRAHPNPLNPPRPHAESVHTAPHSFTEATNKPSTHLSTPIATASPRSGFLQITLSQVRRHQRRTPEKFVPRSTCRWGPKI